MSSVNCDTRWLGISIVSIFGKLSHPVNPVTASLAARIDDRQLLDLVHLWDRLEAMVIAVYRAGKADRRQRRAHRSLRRLLLAAYEQWEPALTPYRVELEEQGAQRERDPFREILRYRQIEEMIGSQAAIEALPDARQTLNHFLLAQVNPDPESVDV